MVSIEDHPNRGGLGRRLGERHEGTAEAVRTHRLQAGERTAHAGRVARERSTTYRDAPPKLLQFIDYEAAASAIHMFQPALVPGLLQTEEYARTAFRRAPGPKHPRHRWSLVKVRMKRQEILNRTEPVELLFVMDEAVIRRQVGGEDVMRRQVRHLVEVAQRKNVTLEVVRFSAGAHAGMEGPFVIFEFPDTEDDDVLYLETSHGELIIRDEPNEIAAYEERLASLRRLSAGPKGSVAFLERVAAGDE